MRHLLTAFRSRALGVAAVAALSGLSASCSSVFGPHDLYTGATANQRDVITLSNADDPLPAPSSGVTRSDLPPPGSIASADPDASYPSSSVVPATTVGSNGTTYVWSAVGGNAVTVQSGESLDMLALKYGVPQNQILNANQLTSPTQVVPGKVLVMPHLVAVSSGQASPSAVAAAMPTAQPTVAATPSFSAAVNTKPVASGATYTVITGDTLMSIAKKTGTDPSAILALNGLGNTPQLKNGQVLKLPGALPGTLTAPTAPAVAAATVPKPTIAPTPAGSTLASAQPKGSTAPVVPATASPGKPLVTTAVAGGSAIPATQASLNPKASLDPLDTPSANGTTFRWPVRGRVIANFGSSPAGQRNDGINLAVPEGTSVKAAEAGTVIYAGNELEGYGNLILVRHADGWVSAYAHNKDLLVKRGDTVARGQIIAHAGMTGSVSAPQVHFELRQGSKPVNPLDYLSG